MTDTKKDCDFVFKIPIVGESDVGKTSLLIRFVDNQFSETTATSLGVDYKIKLIDCSGFKVKLQVWDTAGQERFRTVTSSFYRGCKGIMLVIDLTEKDALKKAEHWQKDISRNAAETTPVFLVGNKSDLKDKRVVTEEECRQFCSNNHPFHYVETSALTGQGVNEAFDMLTKEMLGPNAKSSKPNGGLPKQKNKKEGGTCNI